METGAAREKERGLVELNPTASLTTEIRAVLELPMADRGARLEALLLQHPDVDEVFTNLDGLELVLTDWG